MIFLQGCTTNGVELTEEDFYLNEQGYRVFTEVYHLKEVTAVKVGVNTVPMAMIKREGLKN